MDTVTKGAAPAAEALPVPLAADFRTLLAQARNGNAAAMAAYQLVKSRSGDDKNYCSVMTRQISERCAELAGPHPSAIERLLAETAALCWFEYHTLTVMCAAKCQNREIDRWRDRAHRRYLSALRSLASVRKLISVHIDVQGAFGEQDPLEARRRGTVAV